MKLASAFLFSLRHLVDNPGEKRILLVDKPENARELKVLLEETTKASGRSRPLTP